MNDNKEKRVKDWFDIKADHNALKLNKISDEEKILTKNNIAIKISKLIDGKIDTQIASFPIDVQPDMRQDIKIEIYSALDSLKVIALGVKNNDKILKITKIKNQFTEEEYNALMQIETYINDHVGDDNELKRVLDLVNTKYQNKNLEFEYIAQTGYSFCINYITKVCGIYDAEIRGLTRGDRDRIKKLKDGTSTDKKQSTKNRLIQLDATSVPESLTTYENYDKDDPTTSMLMPKALTSAGAEDAYWGQSDDIKENFIEEAIKGIEDHVNNSQMSNYEKKREKMVFLWGLYKKLGYNVSLLPDEFTEKAKRAEYKKKVPESLIKFTEEWDNKLRELQLEKVAVM